ncbi:MAG: hypothetical protein K8E66_04060, partial [Phycisphaerales bacterium]|nr:hypothetical protein [Phycisphaerales bacterium]
VFAHEEDVAYEFTRQAEGVYTSHIAGDNREPGDTTLTIVVQAARVSEVRTIASGDRIPTERRLDNKKHDWIRSHSPVGAMTTGEDGQPVGGVIDRHALDRYLLRLNRHPGRQVDVALGPALDSGGAVLEYHIAERKPWTAYAQVSNTGTEETSEWRERFGFVHQQLTNRDDILGIEYVTAGFDESHALSASYDTPINDARNLRARIYGSYSEFSASEVAANLDFSGDSWTVGGELSLNIYQRGPLFVDLFAGARYFDTEITNRSTQPPTEGQEEFFIVRGGVRAERNTRDTSLGAELAIDASFPDVTGAPDTISELGRLNADGEWQVLQGEIEVSAYLEPLLNPRRAKTLAHEIALRGRVQHSLDDRLIPQVEQIAGGLY